MDTMKTKRSLPLMFKECQEVFQKNAFRIQDGLSVACNIHDRLAFDPENHDCLGCNLANATTWISRYLERYEHLNDTEESCFFYLLRLYLLVERIDTVLEFVDAHESVKNRFQAFKVIRKWANFIKHPKDFIFVHHPDFLCNGVDQVDYGNFDVVIDTEFVSKYYSRDHSKVGGELRGKLRNNYNVLVFFPDFVRIYLTRVKAEHHESLGS